MLFPYTYVPHAMEKMQDYIDYIFVEVWCKASGNHYDIEDLFAGNNELKEIITELHTSELKGADFFLTGLQLVFEDFKTLSANDISNITHWYHSNNTIELLCANDPSVSPASYQRISTLSSDLSRHLKDFFKNLYSQSFLSLKSVSDRIGTIEEHYHAFMSENTTGKCPFCGIHDVKSIYHSKREAYDHYLPKGHYPFNAINFCNLATACHECNSTYKLSKDPLYNPKDPLMAQSGRRRKSFYPYRTDSYSIEINIEVRTQDWTNIKPEDLIFNTGPKTLVEEIDTWLDVYGIEERYKAKCCSESDGKYWIEQVLDEWNEDGKTPDEFMATLSRHTNKKPYAEANFLKKSFLKACQKAGLLDIKAE